MFSFSLLVLKISFAIYVHALHESLPIGAFLSNIFRVSCRAASYIADYTHTGTPENECPTLYNMSILSPPPPPNIYQFPGFVKDCCRINIEALMMRQLKAVTRQTRVDSEGSGGGAHNQTEGASLILITELIFLP